jgi:hypothetical protein
MQASKIMDLLLEIREITFDHVLSDVTELTAPRYRVEIENFGPDNYEKLWRLWAAVNFPLDLSVSKQVLQEASLMAIRRSKIVLELDDIDEDIDQLQLWCHYLGSFPDDQGYTSVRHLSLEEDLMLDWAPIHKLAVLCPGLREIDITLGSWYLGNKTFAEYVDGVGLSQLYDVDRPWTLNITCFLIHRSAATLAKAQAVFGPFIVWFRQELQRRKSAVSVQVKYDSWN